jgi:hypothetical protein
MFVRYNGFNKTLAPPKAMSRYERLAATRAGAVSGRP